MTSTQTIDEQPTTEDPTLKSRLRAQFRRIEETGIYEPDLSLKEKDPIAFEVLFTKLLQTVTNAREIRALHLRVSVDQRARGDHLRPVHTRR